MLPPAGEPFHLLYSANPLYWDESVQTMPEQHPIAIVGGGPAGSLAGTMLAAGGRQVHLFDEKLAWEKPCGGGVTHKALQQYPFLAEAGNEGNPVKLNTC